MGKQAIRVGLTGLILLLAGWFAPAARAQSRDSLLRVYDTQTIHSYGNKYIKGSRQLSFRALKKEFPPGLTSDLYQKSKQNLVLSRLATVVATAALVGSLVVRKDHEAGGIALLVVGVGFNLGSLHFGKKSTELVDQALWQRNKEVLFDARP